MRAVLRHLWQWSWVVTVPVTIGGLVWLLPAWRDARQFLVWHPAGMHRSSDVDLDLRQVLLSRLAALRTDLASSWNSRWSESASPLARIDLEVAPANIARLNEYLPRSGKEAFVRGLLRYPDGNFEKVGVRYRGDSLHHWGFAAKSWLVRTSKDRPIEGQRRWHLILPRWRSVANYHVNLRMAGHMGLLAADSSLVDLRINGRQHGGIYLLQPQQDESFLRNHRRLPSDLYVGDMTTFDDNFVNEAAFGGLWELPWLWQKAAVNNKYPEDSRRPLEILFFRLNHSTTAELMELLDVKAWADFSAYMQLFGADHIDMGHNWKLLYDAGKLTFVPVVGDGNGLPDEILANTTAIPGRDVSITTPLLARLHQDHGFLRLKNDALTRFYLEHLDRKFFTELQSFYHAVAPTLAVFPQLDWIGTVDGRPVHYFDNADLQQRIARVTPLLTTWFAAHQRNQTLSPEHLQAAVVDPHTLRLAVDGYASARLGWRVPAGATVRGVRLLIHRPDGRTESADVTSRLTTKGDTTWLDWALLAQRQVGRPGIGHARADHIVRPATYDLVFDGVEVSALELVAAGGLGETFSLPRVPALALAPVGADNSSLLPGDATVTFWSGDIHLEGLTELHGPLEIAAGTRVRLGPGASLIARGRVTIRGTASEPVHMDRRLPDQPWGTFALVGSGADGSNLEHCVIRGGSGLVSPFTLFSGMVSVRNVARIRLQNCRIEDNTGYDDLFHAVYSSLDISDCVFRGAFRDGVDLDICQAKLLRTTIEKTGNDALDLMTSEVVVNQCRFRQAGDKGLSAGETSKAVVLDSRLDNNVTGIQAKDGSQALLYNVTFAGNGTHLSAYHKNRSYLGVARLTLAKSAVSPEGRLCELQDQSTLAVLDSQLPVRPTDPLVSTDTISDPGTAARSDAPGDSFGRLLPGGHWSSIDSRRRGSSLQP